MPVLVIGASSQIGHFLLQRLAQAQVEVLALSRVPRAGRPGLAWHVGRLPDRMPPSPGFEAIISCGPLASMACWLASLSQAPAPRLVVTSSMSTESKRGSMVAAEVELARAMREAEQRIAGECQRLGMRWTVLRPTLVYGAGLDRSLSPLARRAMRWRVFPLPDTLGQRQPVHADDVALASLRALECDGAHGLVFALGGGERISVAEMFRRVRASLPVRTLPLPVGRSALALAARCMPRLRGPLSRMDADLVADNGPVTRVLGLRPRPFRPDAACWQVPAQS